MKEGRGMLRYVRAIWPNVPAHTTFIALNRPRYVHLWTCWTDWTDLGIFTSEQTVQTIELCIYMNVPTYLIAHNVHGPCFTSPKYYVVKICKINFSRFTRIQKKIEKICATKMLWLKAILVGSNIRQSSERKDVSEKLRKLNTFS